MDKMRKAFSLESFCGPLRRALPYASMRKAFSLDIDTSRRDVSLGRTPAPQNLRIPSGCDQRGGGIPTGCQNLLCLFSAKRCIPTGCLNVPMLFTRMRKAFSLGMRLCLILLCLSCGLSVTADEGGRVVTPLSLGLTPSLQFPSAPEVSVYGLRAGAWMGLLSKDYTTRVYGVSMGLVTMPDREVTGLQFSGLLNQAETLRGFQIAGLAGLGVDMTGLQCAGLLNWSHHGMTGIQITAGMNIVEDEDEGNARMSGIQIAGLLNMTGKTSGIQVAILNCAKKMSGVQVGLFNVTDDLKGVQIGLLNFVENDFFPGLMFGW